jgi:hypothetical protein
MNAAAAILEHVGKVAKIDREALIAEIERTHDPKVVSPTISTMLRRGELKELANGTIVLGNEEDIEKARQEREQRKKDRDRPTMPPPSPSPHVAPVAGKPRPGSHPTAVAICAELQSLVDKHGPLRATDLNKYLSTELGTNLYYHLKAMTERGELIKRGALYATSPAQFEPRNASDLGAEEPTAAIVDVGAAVAEAEELSRPAPPVAPDTTIESAAAAVAARPGSNPPPPKAPKPPPPPNPPPASRISSIAEVARKHAVAAPEEHVLQIGDIYIAVTAPTTVATRVLSAALAVLGAPA